MAGSRLERTGGGRRGVRPPAGPRPATDRAPQEGSWHKGGPTMILTVGATGSLGGLITRRLLEQGRAVRILVRPGADYAPLVAAGAHPVPGDLKDPASL